MLCDHLVLKALQPLLNSNEDFVSRDQELIGNVFRLLLRALSLSLCSDPSTLTRRFTLLLSEGPHSWAYSQEVESVFQWISLSS